jgi:four helix bundle protein
MEENKTNRTYGSVIPPHGGYDKLKSYQMSLLVYDATVKFCDRFINPKSRTHDQMVQAARSGNKNIAEGSQASGTSKKMELKLVGVARASLEELLGDYQDFLRQRGLAEWGKTTRDPVWYGGWRMLRIGPMGPIGPILRTPRRRRRPTPCSAWCTRQTTCWTSSSGSWSRRF